MCRQDPKAVPTALTGALGSKNTNYNSNRCTSFGYNYKRKYYFCLIVKTNNSGHNTIYDEYCFSEIKLKVNDNATTKASSLLFQTSLICRFRLILTRSFANAKRIARPLQKY